VGSFKTALMHRIKLQDDQIKMTDLVTQAIVGEGTFGQVALVHHKKDESQCYALKRLRKSHVVKMRQQKSIQVEREVLLLCYHPCIVQFIKSFQDKANVYFLTEFLGGGDLFFAIREIGMLTKPQSQFYSGSIILAIEYLHEMGYMYRDLKPENVLLDSDGWCKLVDFGCCKKATRAYTLVGTPEYLAPEVILGKGYNRCADWWSVGVCTYEFVCGPLPFGTQAEDQLELFREILEAPLRFPPYVKSADATTLLKALLERQPDLRLGSGSGGAKDLKMQAYFKDFSFDKLVTHDITPPWKANMEAVKSNWLPPDAKAPDADDDDAAEQAEAMSKDPAWAQRYKDWDAAF